ncbi:MAG: hypothetical protein IPM16_03340 [Chloroflexi bacterium]|nr:hypothetical protein [Chloroflexota bacterium]
MVDTPSPHHEQILRDFEAAHALYRAGRVNEAAALLQQIDHPLAFTALERIGRAPRERRLVPTWLLVAAFLALVGIILIGSALGLDAEGQLRTDLSIGCERILHTWPEVCDAWAESVIAENREAALQCRDYQPPDNIAASYSSAERVVHCANQIVRLPPP